MTDAEQDAEEWVFGCMSTCTQPVKSDIDRMSTRLTKQLYQEHPRLFHKLTTIQKSRGSNISFFIASIMFFSEPEDWIHQTS